MRLRFNDYTQKSNSRTYVSAFFPLLLLCYIIVVFPSCKQDISTKINLDDYAVPEFKYGRPPNYMDWRKQFGATYSSHMARKVSYARIRALRSGNFREDGRGLRIGVFDADQNGVFNDAGTDYLTVAPFASDTLPMFDCVASPIQPPTPFFVKIENDNYRIDSIQPDGNAIWLQPVSEVDSITAFFPTHIPTFDIVTVAGDTLAIKDFLQPGKYLYVECWSTWFQAAINGLPELKAAYTRFKDEVEFLHLVMNEVDYSRVQKHVERYEIPWTQAIYSDELGRQLMQNSIPYGILFAPDGSIVKMGFGPGDLEPFLEEVL